MSRVARAALVLFLLGASPAAAQVADLRLAYFSPQRAFSQSVTGKTSLERVTALQAERSREIEIRNRALATQRQALADNGSVLSEAARTQRQQEVQRFEVDLQRFIEDAQAELMGLQQNIESVFLAKLRPAIDAVVKERGLLLVFNEDTGLLSWADPALDITPEVIRRIDQP